MFCFFGGWGICIQVGRAPEVDLPPAEHNSEIIFGNRLGNPCASEKTHSSAQQSKNMQAETSRRLVWVRFCGVSLCQLNLLQSMAL